MENKNITINGERFNKLLHESFPKVLDKMKEIHKEVEGLKWEVLSLIESDKDEERKGD